MRAGWGASDEQSGATAMGASSVVRYLVISHKSNDKLRDDAQHDGMLMNTAVQYGTVFHTHVTGSQKDPASVYLHCTNEATEAPRS